MDRETSSAYEESKVVAMAEKLVDARFKKVGVVRDCERALENAVSALRTKRERLKLKPP
jgi:hypothetical protein